MNDQEKIFFKNKLKQFAASIIEQRIAASKKVIENAQQAANNEEKSSAGDKYETSRAMGHLEKDMHARQLSENMKELAMLHAVNTDIIYTKTAAGVYLQCTNISFFIAAGLGKQIINSEKILFLSPQSPLAKSVMHKKQGDYFLFNNEETLITDLF
jgi:hypothetical protein